MADMKNKIAIKIPANNISTKALMDLKTMTGKPLAEIKSKIEAGEVIASCDMADSEGIVLLNDIRRAMADHGIEVKQYIDGLEDLPENFDNLENTYREIGSESDYD